MPRSSAISRLRRRRATLANTQTVNTYQEEKEKSKKKTMGQLRPGTHSLSSRSGELNFARIDNRIAMIRSIRESFANIADPHKREKLINAAMKRSKIKLSSLGEIFEFEHRRRQKK